MSSAPMMSSALLVKSPLAQVQRDLSAANDALATYWSRGSSDTDYKCADLHMAAEALMRAIASVALAVERIAQLPVCEGGHD